MLEMVEVVICAIWIGSVVEGDFTEGSLASLLIAAQLLP
jgi:hypothetical protein